MIDPTRIPHYQPAEIEPKWQARWEADGLYHAERDPDRQKFYALTMLPYPSGDLHIGHWYAMTPSDARARYKRMRGYNVFFPIGFDAFGLPAENAAIKRRIHPKTWTYSNIQNMRRQLRSMGAMFDWRSEIISADPKYYHWTQWFFEQFYKHGMAYQKYAPVDFCPNCNTTLAREQVQGEDRHCERCETPVIKKNLNQWFFTTTKYADELLNYDLVDWPEMIRTLQANWIGRSQGATVDFTTETGEKLTVFTTRPDTLWGVTFMVLAPEHPLVGQLTTPGQAQLVKDYQEQATHQSDIQREATDKEKTGIFTGSYAINPVNGERIPIWIADYVMMTYGTGAIMAVPAHDERDFEFALKFGLPIEPVIDRVDGLAKSFALAGTMHDGFDLALQAEGIPYKESENSLFVTIPAEKIDRYVELSKSFIKPDAWNEVIGAKWLFIFSDAILPWDSRQSEEVILARCKQLEPGVRNFRTLMEMLWSAEFYRDLLCHSEYGAMINSGEFTGTPGKVAKQKVTDWLEAKGKGREAVNYRLRDWLISRQRYWGAPIPIIYCPKDGPVPVPENQLPVLLPDDVEWLPTGESPLKLHPTWRFTTCPVCGGPAERETDTMDTFMCSSWYFMRYLSPDFDKYPFDPAQFDYWMPVDTYTGGSEHATMHLIYARFFWKAARDCGITEGPEPFLQLRNQGMVLGEDGDKMSKSRGNVVAPDLLVEKYGADTVRAYLTFFARWELGAPWNSSGIEGSSRWLKRLWSLLLEEEYGSPDPVTLRNLRRKTHQTLKAVTYDFENFEFNTIVSSLMELLNEMGKAKSAGAFGSAEWQECADIYLRMLAPVCPHISEELWEKLGKPYSIHQQPWPKVDEEAAKDDEITLIVQVNGKLRDRLTVSPTISEAEAKALALASPALQAYLGGKEPKKVIYVPGRLINIVV